MTGAKIGQMHFVEDGKLCRKFGFITAIPQSAQKGSGCYVGINTLATGVNNLGHGVDMILPSIRLGSYIAERYVFNQALQLRRDWNYHATVGFDLDGFCLPAKRRVPHVANIKGVLGDTVRFEHGFTRTSMAVQAGWEAEHAKRADHVITISQYCKQRLEELYGVRRPIAVVPEMIDLEYWRRLFLENPASKAEGEFTVLCVCHFYPRKRVELLLQAAHVLRTQIPELRIRIVGDGPQAGSLWRLWQSLKLQTVVTWIGNTSQQELAREYNRADIFCLPSVQEGFGIAFLEAMAAGKPIIAARAAAVPEVVRSGILVEPDDAGALAEGIWRLWREPALRSSIQQKQWSDVKEYEMIHVARRFLQELDSVA